MKSAAELIRECAPYLKERETPAQCIQRNRDDVSSVLRMLAEERKRCEELIERMREIQSREERS